MEEKKKKYLPFSAKQRMILTWWADEKERERYDAVICDGALRS